MRARPSRRVGAGLGPALAGLLVLPAAAAAQAGGGGGFSASEDGSPALTTAGVLLIAAVAVVVLAAVVIPIWVRLRRRRALERRGAREAQIAELNDERFNPQTLKARVGDAFPPMQEAWSRYDVEALRPYASDALLRRLGVEPASNGGRRPAADDLRLDEVTIVRVEADAETARAVAYLGGRRRTRRRAVGFGQLWTLVSDAERGWVVDDIAPASRGDAGRLPAEAVGPGVRTEH